MKPLFSVNNIINPKYRKLFKNDKREVDNMKITSKTKELYINFVINNSNRYGRSNLLKKAKLKNITYLYDKTNTFMI